MSQLLLETIKCLNGQLYHLEYHQARFDLARRDYFNSEEKISLSETINISKESQTGLYRCRILYSEIVEKIEFLPHQYRKIESLKLVEDNNIDYRFKYTNRENLEELFSQRGNCDDILIVKNGFISDSFTANAIFWDGIKWWTSDTCLLPGTQRARLLETGKLSVCRITPANLSSYKKVGLINAMQDFDNMPEIDIKNIIY